MSKTNRQARESKRHIVVSPGDTDIQRVIPKAIPVQFALPLEAPLSVSEQQLVDNIREKLVNNFSSTNPLPPDIVFTYDHGRITIKRLGFDKQAD